MKLLEIAKFPTCIGDSHESLLRSYQLLQKVKEYLEAGVPHKVILDLIHEVETSVV
jgi:hypothetical protein